MDLKSNPFEMFKLWFEEATLAKIIEPNAAAFATVNREGIPSCRMVLLKHFDERGFVFFTNYGSRKSHDIEENPYAAMTFYWKELNRQVCIEGLMEKTSRKESEEYFTKRPRASQIGAWASKQGAVLSSREELLEAYACFEEKFKDKEIPLPEIWGGFRLVPSRIEFWEGKPNRLHDRFNYSLVDEKWRIERISP